MENQAKPDPSANSGGAKTEESLLAEDDQMEKGEGLSGSLRTRKKYKDVADAAQAAFESAAYAAAAARAAVELSRTESHDPDVQNSPRPRPRLVSDGNGNGSKHEAADKKNSYEIEKSGGESAFQKIHLVENHDSESEDEELQNETQPQLSKGKKNAAELKRQMSSSSSDSAGGSLVMDSMSLDVMKLLEKDIVLDDSDDDGGKKHGRKLSSDMEPPLQITSGSQVVTKSKIGPNTHTAHPGEGLGMTEIQHLNTEKRPFSLRNRGVRGY